MANNYPPPRDGATQVMFPAAITLADGLVMPQGAANGNVLVSDGTGRARWSTTVNAGLKLTSGADAFTGIPQVFRASFAGTSQQVLYFLDTDTMNTVRFVLALPSAAAYDITFPDPGANARVLYGPPDTGVVPMRVYYSGATYESKTTAIARFTAFTTTHAGLYRVGVYIVDKVNTVAGTVTTRVYYTDRSGAQGPTTINATVLNGAGIASLASPVVFYATSGSIIEFDNTLGLFTGTYDAYLFIEAL